MQEEGVADQADAHDADAKVAVALRDMRFRYAGAAQDSLHIPQLSVACGERVFIKGSSGSGKTTLLNLLAGVFEPTAGEAHVLGQPLHSLSAGKRDRLRAQRMGIVFQQFNLIPYLSVLENVCLPSAFAKGRLGKGEVQDKARELLSALEIPGHLSASKASALSVGQQQRVAVARALVHAPELVMADEPTSALDADNRDRFIELLFAEAAKHNSTLLFVSHDGQLARHFDRVVDLAQVNRLSTALNTASEQGAA